MVTATWFQLVVTEDGDYSELVTVNQSFRVDLTVS